MKILLLGSLISQEAMEKLNNASKVKASVAPVNYETMLAKGLQENGAEIEAISVPPVASWPSSSIKWIRSQNEQLPGGVEVKWLPFINIQLLKQWSVRRSAHKALKKWLQEHKNDPEKVVLMYSIYPPFTKPAVKMCKKYDCHLSTVIADLPEYMYTWKNSRGLRGIYANYLSKQMQQLQGACDSYILFTEKMAKRMGVEEKPYMVSEGFSDVSIFDKIPQQEKYHTKTVMYAGNLSKLYGIRTLVDGFMQLQGDYELHLYGAGDDASYIQQCAEQDPRIKYMGRVSRTEVLIALKKSHLIAINKPTADDYSNYSFSSKILECMVSGTPVLTTRVGGMPEEYYDYFYFIENETPEGLAAALQNVLLLPESELKQFSMQAVQFAAKKKNYQAMTKEILLFLQKTIAD